MNPTTEQAEALPWFDRAVDWYVDGKPITMRDCIRQQCGDLALIYAEAAYRAALASPAAPAQDLGVPAEAVGVEPVAWAVFHRDGSLFSLEKIEAAARGLACAEHGETVAPLYTHPPQPSKEAEALRFLRTHLEALRDEDDFESPVTAERKAGWRAALDAAIETIDATLATQPKAPEGERDEA